MRPGGRTGRHRPCRGVDSGPHDRRRQARRRQAGGRFDRVPQRRASIDAKAAQTIGHGNSETASLQKSLGLAPDQIQALAKNHPDVFGAPGYAQAFIDVASANGIRGADVDPFLDAVVRDDPDYMSGFFAQLGARTAGRDAMHAASLVDLIQARYPTAARYVQQHSPQLFGADASARRAADIDYENRGGLDPWAAVANLVKSHDEPAYQAQLVQRLENDGSLDLFVESICRNYAYNGWPEAAESAIQSAQGAGVLSHAEAQKYLGRIAATT